MICFYFIVEVFEVWSDLFLFYSGSLKWFVFIYYWSLKWFVFILLFVEVMFLDLFGGNWVYYVFILLNWIEFIIYYWSLKWFVFGVIWSYYIEVFEVIWSYYLEVIWSDLFLDLFGVIILKFLKWFEVLWKYYKFFPNY